MHAAFDISTANAASSTVLMFVHSLFAVTFHFETRLMKDLAEDKVASTPTILLP